jgi:eukaryotic translation initiation factor 2C
MMVERLQVYRTRMKTLPKRIIVFRVGTSDSEIEKALVEEKPRIQEAFEAIQKGYKPALTIIFCGRGHNTRFFVPQSQFDKFENPKAGTVVDQGITPITAGFDFYLQAHASQKMQTARPTRYTVIWDENKFTADELQQGINNLCYLWEPSARSVNLAPPARCAAKASHHARAYVHALNCARGDQEKRAAMRQITAESEKGFVHNNLKELMFYL